MLVGVNSATVLWAHQIRVDIVGIRSTTYSVTTGVIVGCNIVTGVQGGHHGVFVAFIGVIFRAEVVVDKVGITVVIPTCKEKIDNVKTCLAKLSIKNNVKPEKIVTWSRFKLLVNIVSWQLREVGSSIAVAANITDINFIAKHVSSKRCLPIHPWVANFTTS